LPKPEPAPVQVATTPAPERTASSVLAPMVASMIGGGGGNATPGAPASNFDARSLISDSSVLDTTGTKFRTPPGVKSFTLEVEQGKSYMLQTADGNAPTDVMVRRPDSSVLAHGDSGGGYAQVYFKSDVTGTATVVVTFSGTAPDAGIEAHVVAGTPDLSNLKAPA
jgi:hypothetical protein